MPFSLIVQTDQTTCGAVQLVQNQNNVFISERLVVVEGDVTQPHPTATYPAIIKNPNNISKVFINNIPIVVENDGLPGHGSSPHSQSDSLYTNNGLNVKAY